MTRVRFDRVASAEAAAAVEWYNARVPGLGDDLRAELGAAVERIAELPLTWPISAYDSRTRQYQLRRFPYVIVYVVKDDNVIVAAVAHTK